MKGNALAPANPDRPRNLRLDMDIRRKVHELAERVKLNSFGRRREAAAHSQASGEQFEPGVGSVTYSCQALRYPDAGSAADSWMEAHCA
jgi:hypothetical protein